MMSKWVVNWLRVAGPLLFGFVVGSLLSLAIFPNLPNELDSIHDDLTSSCIPNPENLETETQNENGEERMEIRIHPPVVLPENSGSERTKVKVSRPRFYATELDIKDKLFVAVLTDPTTINTLAVASNRTVAHHVSKMVFFNQGDVSQVASGPLNIVNFAVSPQKELRLFHIFDYIGKHVVDNYDWFFIVPDTVYMKGFKLYELVTHLSIGKAVWVGRKYEENPDVCDFEAGFLLSQDLMRLVVNGLQSCREKVYQSDSSNRGDLSILIGSCIQSVAKVVCQEEYNGKSFRSWKAVGSKSIDQLISDSKINLNSDSANLFNSALTVFPISKEADYHKLHVHYCELELEQLNQMTNSINDEINDLTPETGQPPSWPPGVAPHWSPKTRYETFKWEYFTHTLLFTDDLYENAVTLEGQHLKDVKQVVKFAQKFLENGKLEADLVYKRLMSGYRLFDPSRGTDYVVDLIYSRGSSRDEIVKRVHLVRPLSKVEIIPVPYVTESPRITMLLPVRRFEVPAAQTFLSHYAKECLSSNENIRLIVVILESQKEKIDDLNEQDMVGKNNLHQDFVPLLRDIRSLRAQFLGKSKKDLDTVKIRDLDDPILLPAAMDAIVDRYGVDVLYFWVTPWTMVYPEFLNRVRMNTIKATQVFFPIAFKQFNPDLVFKASKLPGGPQPPTATAQIDPSAGTVPIHVHKHTGHFDTHDFTIVSFYGTDFHNRNRSGDRHVDLIHSFLGRTDVHIMRAVDPLLKVRYSETVCSPNLNEDDYARCLLSRREGLASKPQLATLILKHNHDNEQNDNDDENNAVPDNDNMRK